MSPALAAVELWVELHTPADHAAAHAAGLTWAEGQDGDTYRLMGTPAMAEASGLSWHTVAHAPEAGRSAVSAGWRPTPEDVAERLAALVESGATLVQLGESRAREPILALRIGRGSRALRLLGGHHGNEGSSVEMALAVAEALVGGRAALPPDTELWVVPVVNPDGLRADTRANLSGVDLNRNYGWEWSDAEGQNGAAPFSEPETRAIRALARARSFDAGLSLHSGAQNLGWVWNWSADERPVEEPLLVALAEGYAAGCGAPDFWITNGADWYLTRGDSTDWTYGAWGSYDFTLELTVDKSPPVEDVSTYTSWHLDPILDWLTRPPDRQALIVDDTTGEPIPARVTGPDTAPLWSPDGTVARWAEGDAAWTVDAPGYTPAPLSHQTRLLPTAPFGGAPRALLGELPTPRLLSRGAGPTAITLAGVSDLNGGLLTLLQPGELPVLVPANADGTWTLDPTLLAPGAWTLQTEVGVVPRGLFVGEVDDRVVLDDAYLEDGVLTLTGAGFATGAEAWSYGGPARAPHALARLSEAEDALAFALPSTDDDVLVWTNGAWLAVVSVQSSPAVDPSPPPELAPAGEPRAPLDATLTAVGACSSTNGSAGAGALLASALLIGRRRSRGWPPPGGAER
ncbi:MAG: M14 family metallopeptidase [Pseudomonadota bacterium]|nr:M14 family metallopeptidase [Pseudomonadota bacterium]